MTAASQRGGAGWPVVILIALLVLAAFAIVMPAVEMFAEQGDATAQAQQDLAVYRAQIAARPRLDAQLRAVNRREAASDALLGGSNTALAAAAMQSLVKQLVESHSGQIRSAQTLPASTANGLERVEVEYELSLPLGALPPATYDLETKMPYLFLDSVEIRPEIYAAGAASAPGTLHVQWTVHGYRRVEAP